MNNIDVFRDTEKRIQSNERLRCLTETAERETRVIWGGFHSNKTSVFDETNIEVRDCLTLMAAKELTQKSSRVAVLNFANPVEPGGGVLRGASAQEEYLCRASNLYQCLIGPNAAPYYQHHEKLWSQQAHQDVIPFSDAIIYSRDVTVIKDDIGYGSDYAAQQYTPNWYTVDVITCAAPIVKKQVTPQPFFAYSANKPQYLAWYSAATDEEKEQMRQQEQSNPLDAVFHLRVANILESAIDAEADALVLGAFGCGAFHNSPYLVANAFKAVLAQGRYKNSFRHICFAIKRSGGFCKNIEAFELEFNDLGLSEEYNKRRFFM